jgi:hypothetical protein
MLMTSEKGGSVTITCVQAYLALEMVALCEILDLLDNLVAVRKSARPHNYVSVRQHGILPRLTERDGPDG